MKYAHTMQNETSDCSVVVIQTILQRLNVNIDSLNEKLEYVINENEVNSNVQGLTLWDSQFALNHLKSQSLRKQFLG